MLQCSKPFLFILGSILAIEKSMLCSSIVNKAIGQVCRTAGKKTKQHTVNQNGIFRSGVGNLFVSITHDVVILCQCKKWIH